MISKDKARKGRPDGVFTLLNGRYILAEYTTLASGRPTKFFSKLKDDVEGGQDFERLGLTPDRVNQHIFSNLVRQ